MIEDAGPTALAAAKEPPISNTDEAQRRQRPTLRLPLDYSRPQSARAPLFRR